MSVGRPRPDLIARCLPAAGAVDHPVFGLSTSEICTTTNQLRLDDGFKVSHHMPRSRSHLISKPHIEFP